MIALLKKEINSFLNSLIGYMVIIVFLMSVGLFMWVFPGDSNILDNGFANIDTLFVIAPFIFMFLVPAVTMRSFAEEYRQGTIELLLTKPLTELQIVLAKYLANVILVVLSLLPTLVFVYSVYQLGAPVGNIDMGGTWGSYLGLLFLSAGFAAIGVFASSLTSNQIVAFIIGVFLSFFFYTGFQSVSTLPMFSGFDYLILSLGIQEHYISMSRGVIDTRDMIYFLSLIVLFILLTKVSLESRKW